jgi:hypothetical protein
MRSFTLYHSFNTMYIYPLYLHVGQNTVSNHKIVFFCHNYRLTVSAAVRLMPSPPALVLNRKTKMSDRLWKSATMSRLSEILEEPSNLI